MSKKASNAGNQQGTPRVSPNLINHKWGTFRDYTPDTIEFSDDMATLIALLYTDGGISRHHLASWRIFFANSSYEAIELFRQCLVKIFRIPPERVRVSVVLKKYYFAVLTSKVIGNFLVKYFGNFRTLKFRNGTFPIASIPIQKIIKSDKIRVFLRTVFSMDGGVKFYSVRDKTSIRKRRWLERNISLACHHPTLRKQYLRLLRSLGIKAINIESDKVVKIRGRENLEKFANEVGFLKGIKTTSHSKFWAGIEKNKVMKFMINSYKNPAKYISLLSF